MTLPEETVGKKEPTLREVFTESSEQLGWWHELSKTTVLSAVESLFKESAIKCYFISDIVINGDKCLIKWSKKIFQP